MDYQAAWNRHEEAFSDAEVAGAGDFERIGRAELGVLQMEGLQPHHTLVDLGCGSGRLALQVIPYLEQGQYVGIEISESILARAERQVASNLSNATAGVSWIHSAEARFPVSDVSADYICAFSVFTHMEHEDSFRYLRDGLRVVRPGGKFILSCLTLDLHYGQAYFLESAALPLNERWATIRNIATTRDFIDAITGLAGWSNPRWYKGDEANIRPAGSNELVEFGQSVCVVTREPGAATQSGAHSAGDG